MSVTVQEVTGKKEIADFIALPHSLYEDNTCWVPWLHSDLRDLIARKHPLFSHSHGAFLLAYRDDTPAARLFVYENTRYNETHQRSTALFFLLDGTDDDEVWDALFQKALEWAVARNLNDIMGPMGFGGVSGAGILINGFNERAAMTMMAYNHPYYQRQLERLGFAKALDNHSFSLPTSARMPEGLQQAADAVIAAGDYHVLRFKKKKEILAIKDEVLRVFSETLVDHFANYQLSKEETDWMAENLVAVTRPELIKIIAYKDEIVGFLFGFADLSAALQKSKGRLSPLSVWRFMREYNITEKLLLNGMGLVPAHQGTGANALLYAEIEKTIRDNPQYKTLEMVQIQETTVKMLKNAKTLQGEIHKTHRVYEKTL